MSVPAEPGPPAEPRVPAEPRPSVELWSSGDSDVPSVSADIPVPVAPSAPGACDQCLRRSGLIAMLAGHLETAWRNDRGSLRDVLALRDDRLARGLNAPTPHELREAQPQFAPDALRSRVALLGLMAACRHDPAYPPALLDAADAPAVLYVAGKPDRLSGWLGTGAAPAAAIVGARRASPEGLEMARALGRGLAASGIAVVSGMAMGIDSASHRGALQAGGATVAVLACGPDIAYPVHESPLHRALSRDALVVSELPPGVRPRRWAFPARNRIIAALGRLTVVVEGAPRSGSLITAEFATALGREVAAVPGRAASEKTRGTNELLKEGAAVVLNAEDVLDLLLGTDRERASPADAFPPDLPLQQRALLSDVRAGRSSLPALVSAGHEVDTVLGGLAALESRGLVRRAPGGVIVPVLG